MKKKTNRLFFYKTFLPIILNDYLEVEQIGDVTVCEVKEAIHKFLKI